MKELVGVKIHQLHPLTWAKDLLEERICKKEDASIILCSMWTLWSARNNCHHGEHVVNPRQPVIWARDTAFELCQVKQTSHTLAQTTALSVWTPPPRDWFKCNVDGAFYISDRQGAIGVILKDDNGRFYGAEAKWYSHALSALVMEATACRDGLKLAIQIGMHRLLLETDRFSIVDMWKNLFGHRSEISLILSEIKGLSRNFSEYDFCFVRRLGNAAAVFMAC